MRLLLASFLFLALSPSAQAAGGFSLTCLPANSFLGRDFYYPCSFDPDRSLYSTPSGGSGEVKAAYHLPKKFYLPRRGEVLVSRPGQLLDGATRYSFPACRRGVCRPGVTLTRSGHAPGRAEIRWGWQGFRELASVCREGCGALISRRK